MKYLLHEKAHQPGAPFLFNYGLVTIQASFKLKLDYLA
jgi:hypothetical protein